MDYEERPSTVQRCAGHSLWEAEAEPELWREGGTVGQGRSWLGGKPSGLMLLPAQRPPPPWAPPPVGPTLSHVGLHPRTDHYGQQAPGRFSLPGTAPKGDPVSLDLLAGSAEVFL